MSGKGVDSRQQGRREGGIVAKTFRVLLQARGGPGIGKTHFLTGEVQLGGGAGEQFCSQQTEAMGSCHRVQQRFSTLIFFPLYFFLGTVACD